MSITEVHVFDRVGASLDRRCPLFLTIDADPSDGGQGRQMHVFPLTSSLRSPDRALIKRFPRGVEARYVTIGTPVCSYLHFRHVQIFSAA